MNALKIFTVFVVVLFLQSCNREQMIDVPEITSQQQIEKLKISGAKGVPFPKGSKVTKLSDGLVKITLPKDVYFVVKNEEGEVFRVQELGMRCSCSQGSGCSPVKAFGNYYCVMSGCRECSSKLSTFRNKSKNEEFIQIVGVMDEEKAFGLISKEKGLFSITEKESGMQYGITRDFFECKEVKDALDEVYNDLFQNKVPDFIKNSSGEIPPDYVYAKSCFLGNNILLLLHKDMVGENSIIYSKDIDGGAICKCYRGKGCKADKKYMALFCDAGNCSDCAMLN